MRLDFIDLKLFACLADYGSLTLAADRQALALSAASQRLKKMETLYGVELVERRARGIELTAAGQLFLHHARQLLLAAERLNGELGDFAHGLRGEVRLMANTVACNEYLPKLLGRFLAATPRVDVTLLERPSRDIVPSIEHGEADLGVIDGSASIGTLNVLPFARDRLVLIAAATHPLAGNPALAFADALEHDFVGLPANSAMQRHIEDMARLRGRVLHPRVRAAGFTALATLAGAGAGLAVLPERAARRLAPLEHLAVIALSDPWAVREMKLCFKSTDTLSAPAHALLELLAHAHHA
ncbi:LysR substrate-binding domain-containing protein [Crenobacter sp. SG2305]|uniref:LysR substrate-binding domain-containing protein n=1 Tax=Crenobacter oryzisoli TaxID=3056844 RepID=UPI0025AB30B1|nr:LysR substrate-binding domain-containing protein [Crenobacter sp. SG2305]MDN0082306.1 LysR substrate-binding domain-containing protein [Crenobacter sp. SG2305]